MAHNILIYKVIDMNSKKNYRRIENDIKKLNNIETFHLDKEKDLIYVSFTNDDKTNIDVIKKCFVKYEKNIKLEKQESKEKYRKVLYLKGLDCGHCAMKIETIAKKSMQHDQLLVDFATTRFIIETSDKDLVDHIIERVEECAHKVDPKIVVLDSQKDKKERVEDTFKLNKKKVVLLILGVAIFLIGLMVRYILTGITEDHVDGILHNIANGMFIVTYILIGHEVIIAFFKNLINRRIFDENFLMTLATIGAIVTGHYVEAVMVMVLYQIGEQLQETAVNKSRKSISELLTLEAKTARIKIGTEVTEVDVDTILPGDTIVVQVGEMIPLDGVITNGKSVLDTKSITGESRPISCKVKDEVISGSINIGSVLEIKVTRAYSDSMITKILDLVENASTKKAQAEHFITKFARIYTPVIVVLALIFAIAAPLTIHLFNPELSLGVLFKDYIYRAMFFLVVSCPCAVVISVPLAFFAGIGLSSKRGILVKGSNYLESLAHVNDMVFDKTGTLTKGTFTIQEICPEPGVKPEEVLKTIAYVEYFSNHPIGLSVVEYYGRDKIFPEIISEFQIIEGKGVKAEINGSVTYAGNRKMIKEMFPFVPILEKNGAIIYVIKEKKYLGAVVIGDVLKDEAHDTMVYLRKNNITTSMLTGDYKTAGEYTANMLDMDNVYTDLLPDKKVDILTEIMSQKEKGTTVYVGDGINDAPVIATADVGIAMGSTGSDATIEVADVVIMSDNLEKIEESIIIAKATRKKVLQNIIFALGIKAIVLVLSSFGDIPLWLAIFSDVGVSLLAILNSMSLTSLFKNKQEEIVEEDE